MKRARITDAERMAAYEAGQRRVLEYIKFRAKRDKGIWAHPEIPYRRLIGDSWLPKLGINLPPHSRECASLRAEVEKVMSYDREGYSASNDLNEARAVARLLLDNDLGTVDIELLDMRSEGNGDMDDYYRAFRVGDRNIVTRGYEIIDVEQIRDVADGLREEAKSFDEFAALIAGAELG